MSYEEKKVRQMMNRLISLGIFNRQQDVYYLNKEFDMLFRGHLVILLRKDSESSHFENNIILAYVETLEDFGFPVDDSTHETTFAIEILRTYEKEEQTKKVAKLLGK